MNTRLALGATLLSALLLATTGCSGDDDGSSDGGTGGTSTGTGGGASGGSGTGGGSSDDSFPEDTSAAGITAFLQSGAYTNPPWVADVDAPRDASSVVSPHGRVRVYLNPTAVASQAAGKGGIGNPPADVMSMAVKELYDESDVLVGKATLLKTEEGDDFGSWTYYCWGPASRCDTESGDTTEADPIYGLAISECNGCHGGSIFTMP